MQSLRNASLLARLVLAWFVLSIGVAVASPAMQPVKFDLVCSGGAMKLLHTGEEGDAPIRHTLDCPLCAPNHAPPALPRIDLPFVPVLGHGVRTIPAARIAALTAAPLPARGPPSQPNV